MTDEKIMELKAWLVAKMPEDRADKVLIPWQELNDLVNNVAHARQALYFIFRATRDDNPVAISDENLMSGINMIAHEALSALDAEGKE